MADCYLCQKLTSSWSYMCIACRDGTGHLKKMETELKKRETELDDKLEFLTAFGNAFMDGSHTDIQLEPRDGPSIPAHRALLAVRSSVLKNALESDNCKAPAPDTIAFPELNYDELQLFLEFLYRGSLPFDKMSKHVCTLYIAADKYEIPFLLKSCEKSMITTLDSSNALEFLEASEACPSRTLKDSVMKFIVDHMRDIAFSDRYEAFALKNPQLIVQITRAFFKPSNT